MPKQREPGQSWPQWGLVALAVALALPGIYLRLSGTSLGTVPDTALHGLAIVAAAFLLSWAAEAAQVDVSQGLALALIAFIAVLPEYAVDVTFAWKAGRDPQFAPYAVANMTGANRVLVGLAWPLIFGLFWLKARRPVLTLERGHAIEIFALALATVYSFTMLLRREIGLLDTAVLAVLFIAYLTLIARAPTESPHLVGPSRALGTLPRPKRYAGIAGLFLFAAIAIFAVAEPFAGGLITTGTALGIDQFLLVQVVAPIASEAPEFLIAGLLAVRGRAGAGLGALISSKVNQWTLLIGALPVAYALAGGHIRPLPLDARQMEELFLTAAQSAFAVALLARLNLTWWGATTLFGLFAVQFAIPTVTVRLAIAWLYVALAVLVLAIRRTSLRDLTRTVRECAAAYATSRQQE